MCIAVFKFIPAPCTAHQSRRQADILLSLIREVYLASLLHGIVTMYALYFLPNYFQCVLTVDASNTGIHLLPTILALLLGSIIGELIPGKFGCYKPILVFSFALIVFDCGFFTLLDERSSTAAW